MRKAQPPMGDCHAPACKRPVIGTPPNHRLSVVHFKKLLTRVSGLGDAFSTVASGFGDTR
jgi:hypothetical protein